MKIHRRRQQREHARADGSARIATADTAAAATSPAPESPVAGAVAPADPPPAAARTSVPVAVERYADAWREAATDAELAFRWWIDATLDERRAAATGYFAAFEREMEAAGAYRDAWESWRSAPA